MEGGTELVSSAASGSYGATTQTENDETWSEGGNDSEETLNLVQGAVLQTLQKHSQASSKRKNADDDEQGNHTQALTKSSNPEDIELLAHLLKQVHDVKRNQARRKPPPPEDLLRPPGSRRRGRSKKPSEELRMTLKAATMAAKAAADAAEAAAVSVARNTEAIEYMMKSMVKKKKKPHQHKKSKHSDEKKAIVKSNQRTHWILGYMAITTIAWRFGVVKVAKRISSKLNDPLGYVGGLIGNNDDHDAKKAVEEKKKKAEAADEKGNFLDKLPHIDMPEFLHDHGTDNEVEDTSFFTKTAAAVDVKTKEVEKTAFSFANLLHIKPKKT